MAAVQPVSLSSPTQPEIQHILVTTDFSECSRNALQQAAAIARLHGADLVLLHVIAPPPMIQNALEPATWEVQDVMNRAHMEMASAHTAEILAGIPHHTVVENGDLEEVLSTIVKQRSISLLVLGTHGRGGLKKVLLGSTAEVIFRLADCPVLTVGPRERSALLSHGKFDSVVFTTDFSPGSLHALPYAILLAQESRAALAFLHVVQETSITALYAHEPMMADARKRLEALIPAHANVALPLDIEVITGFPVEQILAVAEKKQADLIVMGVHKSRRLGAHASAHLPWSIAQGVVCHAKCPVLTVRG